MARASRRASWSACSSRSTALEPSATAKPAASGLGLPIARNILRAHGGDVVLANREDGGGLRATGDAAGVTAPGSSTSIASILWPSGRAGRRRSSRVRTRAAGRAAPRSARRRRAPRHGRRPPPRGRVRGRRHGRRCRPRPRGHRSGPAPRIRGSAGPSRSRPGSPSPGGCRAGRGRGRRRPRRGRCRRCPARRG